MKKNIAIFIHSFGKGGAEKVASTLVDSFDKTNSVILVLLRDEIVCAVPKGVEKVVLKGGIFQKIFAYKKLCEAKNIDISLSFLTLPNLIAIGSKIIGNKAKIFISEHTVQSIWRRDERVFYAIKFLIISIFYRFADKTITVSKKIAQDLVKNFFCNEKKIITIYNPFDIEAIIKKSQEEAKDIAFDKKITFISIGTLYKVKNFPLIISSFAEIKEKNSQLLILGEGEDLEELKKLVQELNLQNRVYLLGFQTNPYKYLAKSDIFVLGSNQEGLPNVIIEALACGCAVVSTDCTAGPREILAPKSDFDKKIKNEIELAEFGILTPVGMEERMIEALNAMIEKKESYRSKALIRAIDFSLKNGIDKYKREMDV